MTKKEWEEVKNLVEQSTKDVLAEYGRRGEFPNPSSEAARQIIARDITRLVENRAIAAGIVPSE